MVDTDAEWSRDFVGECDFVDGVVDGWQWLSMGELGTVEDQCGTGIASGRGGNARKILLNEMMS